MYSIKCRTVECGTYRDLRCRLMMRCHRNFRFRCSVLPDVNVTNGDSDCRIPCCFCLAIVASRRCRISQFTSTSTPHGIPKMMHAAKITHIMHYKIIVAGVVTPPRQYQRAFGTIDPRKSEKIRPRPPGESNQAAQKALASPTWTHPR